MAARTSDLTYPTNHLLGVIDERGQAAQAAAALTTEGFRASDVTVLRGDEGAERLAPSEGMRGMWTKLVRAVQYTRDILERHGAHFLNFFGRCPTEDPAAGEAPSCRSRLPATLGRVSRSPGATNISPSRAPALLTAPVGLAKQSSAGAAPHGSGRSTG
jgi:hypothetical protein